MAIKPVEILITAKDEASEKIDDLASAISDAGNSAREMGAGAAASGAELNSLGAAVEVAGAKADRVADSFDAVSKATRSKTDAIKSALSVERSEVEMATQLIALQKTEQEGLLKLAKSKGDEASATQAGSRLRQLEIDQLAIVARAKRSEAAAVLSSAQARREAFAVVGPLTQAQLQEIEVAQNTAAALNTEADAADVAAASQRNLGAATETATPQLTKMAAAVAGVFAVDKLIDYGKGVNQIADDYKNLEARIKLAIGPNEDLGAAVQAVGQVAQETFGNLDATAALYARLAASSKELGISNTDALAITKTINQSIQVSGASAQASEASVRQLVQALQSGTLRGDEFNSIMEQAPRLAKALADGLGVPIGALRGMAEQGEITSARVVQALKGQADAINKEFETLPLTTGRAMEKLATQWTLLIGKLTGGSQEASVVAESINALAENLESVVGVATRAGAVLTAALAVQAVAALRAYAAEVLAAKTATSLLTLEMSKVPKVIGVTVAVTGFEAGYQVGTMLYDNFELARKLGVGIVAYFESVVSGLTFLKDAAAAVFTDDTVSAAFDRMEQRSVTMRATIAEMWKDAENAPGQVATAAAKVADTVASSTNLFADAAKRYVEETKKQVEAQDALRIARSADAQVALSGLNTQLELARQSENMARLLGNEKDVRAAKILQMQIEIQITQAKVNLARVEAEGSIAVAAATLEELKAKGELTAVKEAELQASIKIAQAKIAEAEATGKSVDVLNKQLELFKKAGSGAGGYANDLDNASRGQRNFAAATHEANDALREQAALANAKYASPLGADKYSAPKGGGVTGNTREERLKGQSASDESLRFDLLAKLNSGQLSEADVADLKNVVGTIKTNQAVFDSLPAGASSLEALADDRKWQAIQTRFEQAIATLEGGSSSRAGAAAVGRTVNVNINTAAGTRKVPTSEAGAAELVAALREAGISAGR